MNPIQRSVGGALVLSMAVAATARAQFGSASLLLPAAAKESAAAADEPSSLTVIVSASPRLTFRADTRGGDADVLVSHNNVGVTFLVDVSPDVRLTAVLNGGIFFYDWGGSAGVFPDGSDSFEDLYSASLLLSARLKVSGPWAVIVGGIGRAQWEEGADLADSLSGGGFIGGGYTFEEGTWIDVGLGIYAGLEDDAFVVPYLNIRLPISDRVRFEAQGLGVGVVAAVTDDLDFRLKGEVEFRNFRLNDSRPAWRDGIVRDLRIPVGGEFSWRPIEGLTLSLEGGVVVYQEYEFADEGGDEISDIETEPAAFVGLRLEYRF
jgi:hypothetical protein